MIVTAAIAGVGILVFSSASAATAVSAPRKSCTFTWFNIDDRHVLSAVSEAKTLAKGEKWVPVMQVLRSGVAQVTGVKLDKPQAAITSLGKRVRQRLEPIGRTYPSKGSQGEISGAGAKKLVAYQKVHHLVDADFVVECAGKRLGSGHATSWNIEAHGTARCGVKTGDKTRISDTALKLAC
ncbi:hypothetical protein [Acrocarpospora catenulata]|uniref:hypothetical protein n=1 Tax=Acrocarpospora catenulata TaxID=2836182 RepID=UPI001BDB2481|nr:hypothetical protein [Acrocarpospora catenulata]